MFGVFAMIGVTKTTIEPRTTNRPKAKRLRNCQDDEPYSTSSIASQNCHIRTTPIRDSIEVDENLLNLRPNGPDVCFATTTFFRFDNTESAECLDVSDTLIGTTYTLTTMLSIHSGGE